MLSLIAWVGIVTSIPAIGCGIVGARLGKHKPESFRRVAQYVGRVVVLLLIIVLWTLHSTSNLLWLIMFIAFGISWSCFVVGGVAASSAHRRKGPSEG
jgi:hypothetical protein